MRMSRRIAALVLALVMALSLAACQGDEEPESGSKGSSNKGSSQKEDPDWPVQIGDTDIPEAPQKVVSLSPGTTEMLFEMGLGSRVVGVSGYCDYPQAEVEKRHRCGTVLAPDTKAIREQEDGAHILDVNVGLPGLSEADTLRELIPALQAVTDLPLQIDTSDAEAMEQAARRYNGRPMYNSGNGKKESMEAVFPIVKKYGGVVVALTIDEDGIPDTAEGRVRVAGKIIGEAEKYGIDRKDIVIDVLAMTISSDPDGAKTTLKALRQVREKYGVCTVLGVSNISFGLPCRPVINANFYTMALQSGLSAGIINPLSEDMMRSYYAYRALMNYDENCEEYIRQYAGQKTAAPVQKASGLTLKTAILKGLKEEAHHAAREMVKTKEPLSIINEEMIPALDEVGKGFEKGTVFLPQLLMSADAAKIAFAVLKEELSKKGTDEQKKEKVILATVKGDIHDIGKNIVKVLLENYSFDVIDLGKDVAPETVLEAAVREDVRLVGLSALMTTTVVSMEDTIKLLRKEKPDCRVMVGGAVLNQEYADMIGADFYGKDAMQSVYYAKELFAGKNDKKNDN